MLSRWVLIASLQVLLCTGVSARDLPDDLRPLFEGFQAHRRVAIGYLRTQNIELGAVEIERRAIAGPRIAGYCPGDADRSAACVRARTDARR